jgi:putative transposase
MVAVDRYAPTTQTCSDCGALTGPSGPSGLKVRQWRCDACGAVHDRDHNAAINIRELGIAQLLVSWRRALVGRATRRVR